MSDSKSDFIFSRGDNNPTRYFFVDCLGRKIFVKAKTRKTAQKLCNEYTGKDNLYIIRDVNAF